VEAQIPLTSEQRQALAENDGGPVEVLDAESGSTSVLMSRDKYEELRTLRSPDEFHVRDTYDAVSAVFGKAGWDDPQMDAYNEE
jgi:hypothetical protein